MSAITAPATRRTGISTAARTWRVIRHLAVGLRPMIAGYWLVMVVSFLAVGFVIHIVTGATDKSVWDIATQSPKYFCAAVGMMVTPAFLSVMVAHGVTRRTFVFAGSLFLTLTAAATSALWVVAYLVERVVFAWQDWPQEFINLHLFDDTSQVGLVFLEFSLFILAHEAAGWLIGTSFYRFGVWRGIALLPLGVLPAVGSELLLRSQWVGQALESTDWDRPPLFVAASGGLLISALGFFVNYLLLRSVGLKPPRS
jgi:hypothetical protein